uniref:Elongation factor Ts, mitochondrial n=2 Tax=Macrostomum lignano TaxID=282301 RepID=A0A1I8J4I3_9PLAT
MRLSQILAMCSSVSKQALMQLRQTTGYPMLACRQALSRCNGDVSEAKAWLDERAQAEGWAKAEKLIDRTARQGLLGIVQRVASPNCLSLLELRCETDFVARNARFQTLLSEACNSLADNFIASAPQGVTLVPQDRLLGLKLGDSSLADSVASLVGSVGENIICGRALVFNAQPDSLALYCHSPWQGEPDAHPLQQSETGSCQFGRYAAAVAYSGGSEQLAYQICQHIVGRNPARLDSPQPNPDPESEDALLRQEFLLDETRLVGDVLQEAGMQVAGFFRLKCAEE